MINDGTIISQLNTTAGVSNGGGLVTNGTAGDTKALIVGAYGVSMGGGGVVSNLGSIIGQNGAGVYLAAPAVCTNGSRPTARRLSKAPTSWIKVTGGSGER